jgi:putative nucleotidyltransferase with HDIG domain
MGQNEDKATINRDTVLRGVEMLPPVSPTVLRLAKTIHDPEAGANEIERIVNLDPALVSNVLRLANSAYFGLQRKVASLRQAIIVLGSKRVFELAMSSAFGQVIPRTVPGYQLEASEFWLHSMFVAILSELLAKNCGFYIPDLTFTAGLLHDVGKLVLGAAHSLRYDIGGQCIPPDEENPTQLEQDLWGMSHIDAGLILAEEWQLPDQILWAAAYHHAPGHLPPKSDQVLVDLVHTADAVAHGLRRLQKGDDQWLVNVDERVSWRLQLDDSEVQEWAQQASTDIEATARLYEMG